MAIKMLSIKNIQRPISLSATKNGAFDLWRRRLLEKLRGKRNRFRALIHDEWYREQNRELIEPQDDPGTHYERFGVARGCNPNPLFDTLWYLRRYPDVASAGINPLMHYILHGAEEGRDPGPSFSTSRYLASHPKIAKAGINPLEHYFAEFHLLEKKFEECDDQQILGMIESALRAGFDAEYYKQAHKDVAESGMDPFTHFLKFGYAEGRATILGTNKKDISEDVWLFGLR